MGVGLTKIKFELKICIQLRVQDLDFLKFPFIPRDEATSTRIESKKLLNLLSKYIS